MIHPSSARAALRAAGKTRAAAGRDAGQLFALAIDFARMASSVVVGVMALASTLTWMIAGLPDFSAASNALAKSAVFSTVAPKPPQARAKAAKSGLRRSVPTTRFGHSRPW